MNFDYDLLDMMDPNEFGSYVHLPDGSTVLGVLDMNPVVFNDGQSNISTNTQLLIVRSVDIQTLTQDDEIEINNITYVVSNIQDDGTGAAEITLHKV